MNLDPDRLTPWLAALPRRIACGELDHLPPVYLDEQYCLEAAVLAEVLLAEFVMLEQLPPRERDRIDTIVARRSLLWDLLWLQQHIG